ncbi:MAG TPA: ATP-binding cassette domain-containing protein [Oligoflexia bacterium]|nr:ATP-binding cassette domain-containing protein [Oligoflexia bacterium]
MLKVADAGKAFGVQEVLHGISFVLRDGEIVGLVGPSGAGKSVLLKLLGRVIRPDQGSIQSLDARGNVRPCEVGFLFQEGALFDSMSVIENAAFPLLSAAAKRTSYDEAMERAFDILKEVGLAEAYRKMPGQLSGGMRRRAALARALVHHPDLVLLDDPTGGLDPVAASVIMNLIRTLHEHYQPTIVMVSHDIRRLMPAVRRVLALFAGRLVCDQSTESLACAGSSQVVRFLSTRYDFSQT